MARHVAPPLPTPAPVRINAQLATLPHTGSPTYVHTGFECGAL